MNLRQIRYFLAVADAPDFARAAAGLHISQTALSQCILCLEQSYGGRLLERSRRGVRLTPLAQVLLPSFRSMQEGSRLAREQVSLARRQPAVAPPA